MKRKASAAWSGGIKDGQGTLTAPSGVLDATPYSFKTRFEGEPGTNPEELIAAAHAGCFSMALSKVLADDGMTPKQIDTTATVTLEASDGGFSITKVHLVVEAEIEGGDAAAFQEAAGKAKAGCPVSKVLNAEITMDASLRG